MICTECSKEYEHDLYHCWCNECGVKVEKGVCERYMKLSDEQIKERNGQWYVSGNLANADEVIIALRASEQAWKAEAEKWKQGYEVYKKALDSVWEQLKDSKTDEKQLQVQLNQAVEILKEIVRLLPWPSSEPFIQGKIKDFQVTLSQEGVQIQLRQEVQWFAEQMELTLRKNDFKGGWKHCTLKYLFGKLTEEVEELSETTSNEEMIKEASDVANIALMIADLANISIEGHKP